MISFSPPCDILAVFVDVNLTLENSSVFQLQVGNQLLALRALGYQVSILTVYDDQTVFDRIIGKRFQEAGIQVLLIKKRGLIANILGMAQLLRTQRRIQLFRMAYVRGIWGPLVLALANPLRRLPYVYDVRGALVDETNAVGRSQIKQWIYKKLETWGICGAKKVTAVSRPLADAVSHSHSIESVEVIPCCVQVESLKCSDEVRQEHRHRLGYSDHDIVLVYSGGLSHYQQIPAMLDLWRRLLDLDDLKFLLLTNTDPQRTPFLTDNVLIPFGQRIQRFSLLNKDVATFLATADIGFMLRDTRELNRVASPVKFAEYLAAGLAIVASPGTGDISSLIEKNQLGALVDPSNLSDGEKRLRQLLERIRAERLILRERAQLLAKEHYDWHAYTQSYINLYGSPSSSI